MKISVCSGVSASVFASVCVCAVGIYLAPQTLNVNAGLFLFKKTNKKATLIKVNILYVAQQSLFVHPFKTENTSNH